MAGRVFQGVPAPLNLMVPEHSFINDDTLACWCWSRRRIMLMKLATDFMGWIDKRLPVTEAWNKHVGSISCAKKL